MEDEYEHLRESQIDSTSVFRGSLLDVRCDRVRLPNGGTCLREYVKHQGAAVVIAQRADQRLLFVRQYRYPLQRPFLELPAGKIDPGETPADTARRELREETGYVAEQWRHLGVMHPCVGYSDERIEIFLASNVQRCSPRELDDNEFIDVFTLSLAEALEAAREGRITDAKTLSGLFWAEKVLDSGW
ncbi:NUDIX domain-containing protein [Accumulibacter sp.]|uniref:NUDIX domain-containing protein n=1 Tax=Accumulibacter sp. TaxID=2053492 RepID=UPI00263436FF|nr:NUDIX hydrolase [Accumulibacter sp.]MDS4055292.1 NUDIX hydrolase [Accumulibacter sp.]